ncbi:MAG: site-specific integrase [Burkholderia sp.]
MDNYTKTIKSFFDFAIQIGKYAFENPFANMHLVKKSDREKHTDSWLPYTSGEVQRLFVVEHDDYVRRFNKPDTFFAPLIGLTMGMRIEEIAQLHVSDIYEKNGVWLIDINNNGDNKEVKTSASVRQLPLPTVLSFTNFLEYHQKILQTYGPTSHLFPYLVYTASNGYAKNIGYNWTRYKQEFIQVDVAQKNFHSLRKTLGALMIDHEFDLPLRKRILGHSMNGDITQTIYGKECSLEYIRACLDKINWGIDFRAFRYQFKNHNVLDGWVRGKEIKLRKKALTEKESKK